MTDSPGLVARLDDWRRTLTIGNAEDGRPPPTDEEVLDLFLIAGIADFLDAELAEIEEIDRLGDEYDDTDRRVEKWVDIYAAAFPESRGPQLKVPLGSQRRRTWTTKPRHRQHGALAEVV